MLNETEKKVFKALANNALACAGGDFGFTDEVDYASLNLTGKQYSGYVSSLTKKGFVDVNPKDEEYPTQFYFSGDETRAMMIEVGIDPQKFDSLYKETKRNRIINELRNALYLAESPKTEVLEFEINDVGFCFEDLDE